MSRLVRLSLVALTIICAAASPAFAKGKGKGHTAALAVGPPSIVLDTPDPHYGDTVTFTWTSDWPPDENNTGPWLRLQCYQAGDRVFFDQRAGFEGGWNYGIPFVVGGSVAWPSGAADCTAEVGHYTFVINGNQDFVSDASTTFMVAA